MKLRGLALIPLAAFLAACGGEKSATKDAAGDSTTATSTTSSTSGDSGKTATAPDDANAWAVSPRGAGPVRVGMTADEAMKALGTTYEPGEETACETISSSNLPVGVSLMAVDGRVVRVDVTQGTVATAEGARIGDAEEKLMAMYGSRVTVQPHKYTDGHYLVVAPPEPADSAFRLVFETDGKTVTRYRAGQRPQVEWVEGCA